MSVCQNRIKLILRTFLKLEKKIKVSIIPINEKKKKVQPLNIFVDP